MKFSIIALGVLAVCALSLAIEHGPVLHALQPNMEVEPREVLVIEPPTHSRQKRHLLLGALGAGALGAGVLGAGIVGAGALGAGALGAGLIGAKAGLVGGALVGGALGGGRSFGGGYHYGGGYGYGGYGGGYRTYYPSYVVEDSWC